MITELIKEQNVTYTENGAKALYSTGNACLDLFGIAGALRMADTNRIIDLFTKAYAENKDIAMRILFYARDIRGGLGERRIFRVLLRYAAAHYSESVSKNISLVPEFGRFDDCLELLGTYCERQVMEMFKQQLLSDVKSMKNGKSVSLLAKWLPSVNASSAKTKTLAKHIARSLHMSDKQYRTMLSELRGYIDVLERRLCVKDYSFRYENQPSKALFKYRNAFIRNDGIRYEQFLADVREGRLKMNAACIYPYEIVEQCVRPKLLTERQALDATWNSLPDYTDHRNAIAVVDGSGSMYAGIGEVPGGGLYSPISVAVSLGMYFAEHNKGAFHNKFITFCERPRLIEIKGNDVYEKVKYCMSYNEVANTDLYQVFMLLLIIAVKNRIPQEELPETIYIISDMEFDVGVNRDQTVFEDAKEKYEDYGYRLPNVVYWNVDSRRQQFPVDMNEKGVALVSGGSPTIFKMAMSQSVTPDSFMLETLNAERYRRIVA